MFVDSGHPCTYDSDCAYDGCCYSSEDNACSESSSSYLANNGYGYCSAGAGFVCCHGHVDGCSNGVCPTPGPGVCVYQIFV